MVKAKRDANDITHNSNKEDMKIRPWNLLKLTGYYFVGTSEDVDVYFEWERKINAFFSLCNCPEFEKVFIAAGQLIEDAQTWWSKEMIEEKYSGFVRNPTWDVMRNLMRKQYIPRDQYQDIRKQFRTLSQGDKTIMEYQKQFNHLRIRLNSGVSNENIINNFVDRLSEDIRFQLQECKWNDLEELFQQTIQIEVNTQIKSIVMEKTHNQDLRTNHFQEGGYDEVIQPDLNYEFKEDIHILENPITQHTKNIQEDFKESRKICFEDNYQSKMCYDFIIYYQHLVAFKIRIFTWRRRPPDFTYLEDLDLDKYLAFNFCRFDHSNQIFIIQFSYFVSTKIRLYKSHSL